MKRVFNSAWFREVSRRIKAQVVLKSFGIPAFMALFFVGYFLILNHAVFPVAVMPLTVIDRFVPYQTSAWLLYVSLWIYVQLPPTFIDNRRELVMYGCSAAGVSLIGFAIFILWPTAVPSVARDAVGSSLASIRNLDTTGNSCPSLHVAFSVFTAVWIWRFLRQAGAAAWIRFLNVCWCLGIVYSTLATKQHVMLDAIPGALLGFAGAVVQARVGGKSSVSASQPALVQSSPAARKL